MNSMARQRLSASVLALALGMALHGVATAQGTAPASPDPGMVTGQVARCINGAETPAGQVAVGIEGGSGALARTDSNGEFFLSLPPGQYNVIATAIDGSASRQYIPVDSGQSLDIGILDIGGSVSGCGPDTDITAPVLPTLVPTLAPTPEPAAPTAVPVATLVPTPAPPTDAPPADDPAADPAFGA